MKPVLSIESVSKAFPMRGSSEVLHAAVEVSLDVAPGEVVALVGESGSGKSTVARIALALEKPDAGRVMLREQDLHSLGRSELRLARRDVQPIFQNYSASFNPRRRIDFLLRQASRSPALSRHQLDERNSEILNDVGLSPGTTFMTRYPHQLSGGQKQRLAVARALAMDPVVIVADEPLSGADVSIRGQILNLLDDVRSRSSVAILMISHDVSTVRAIADRVFVLYRGAVVESGPPDTVLVSPRHEYTQRLLAAVPELPAQDLGPDTS